MNIVVYGATGNAGSEIVKELLRRGHKVTGVARNVDSLKDQPGVAAKTDNLSNVDRITEVIKGADAVVSAYQPPADNTDALIDVTKRQIDAVKKAGVARLIVVGGAGQLEVAPGVTLIKSGYLPAEYMPIALSHEKAAEVLKASSGINWTYIAPAAYFVPGERTGKYRSGTNNLVSDEKGESRISFADYAIALVDEVEKPQHERALFSVGY
ncbi:NAD(P)-dependent oxidoreductase [Edaphobacter sp. 12200R-103]|jgi:putative NADH-flavin reductase|uniref:NAD(P)-dependent oxidoreductase n=1 Tax=Edaphobacter sp. 12200R-103 TaxID=2703788 RepID=UPI00138D70C7|nr:NAD(P)-dependent oxidoreductase [Edaphobacter sp. 12200R-103]QHS50731.1 NAD(P)-dependent oxidoreductase [Edaphobacter sp. 12200R-103]